MVRYLTCTLLLFTTADCLGAALPTSRSVSSPKTITSLENLYTATSDQIKIAATQGLILSNVTTVVDTGKMNALLTTLVKIICEANQSATTRTEAPLSIQLSDLSDDRNMPLNLSKQIMVFEPAEKIYAAEAMIAVTKLLQAIQLQTQMAAEKKRHAEEAKIAELRQLKAVEIAQKIANQQAEERRKAMELEEAARKEKVERKKLEDDGWDFAD